MARLYPSRDLHFYSGSPGVQLSIFESLNSNWTDLSTIDGFQLDLISRVPSTSAQPIASLTGTRIDPGAEGTQLASLRVTIPYLTPNAWDIAVRVTVHHRLHALLLPVSTLTLETDRADRVLTVYGQFADASGSLSTFDITRHDYLQYTITSLTGAPDAVRIERGRIRTGRSAGSAQLTVSAIGGPSVSLTVNVLSDPADRPILKRIFQGGSVRKRSLLFLSEGFTATEQPRFESLCRALATQLLQHVSPYDLLRESFDVYSAFVPSSERGVTLGPPVVQVASPNSRLSVAVSAETPLSAADFTLAELVRELGWPASPNAVQTLPQAQAAMGNAHQLSQVTFETWRLLANLPPQTRVRESAFGFIMGDRHYSTQVTLVPFNGTPLDIATSLMMSDIPLRTPWFDDRRLPELVAGFPPDEAHVALQDKFVKTLRTANGPLGFGNVWAKGGDSFGLVIYVVNHDEYGGLGQNGFVSISVGADVVLSVVPSIAVPGLFDVAPVPVPLSSDSLRHGFKLRPLASLADILAHELGHSVPIGALNDEYGGLRFSLNDNNAVAFAEKSANTQVLANASMDTAIQANLLKWNWERVRAAAAIEQLIHSGTQLTIVLNAEDWARWPSGSVRRRIVLRKRGSLSIGVPKSDLLEIQAIDPVNQALRVAPGNTSIESLITVFGNNGIVILPLLDADNNVHQLVNPHVIAAMSSGPFMRSPACSTNANPMPAAIPGFQMPRNRNRLLAAFETGAGFTCGVVRSSADCKMRTAGDIGAQAVPVDFCFVCKYAIIDTIDPGSHGELDRNDYPK